MPPPPVPLQLHKSIIRITLTSAVVYLVVGLFRFVSLYDTLTNPGLIFAYYCLPPIPILLHHTLRLWPRKSWLIVCELVYSFIENVALVVALVPALSADQASLVTPPVILHLVSGISLGIFSGIALFFLFWDTFVRPRLNLLLPYDIFADYPAQGQKRWGVLFGVSPWKSRFRSDNYLIRWSRGLFAVLCLLLMTVLGIYVIVLMPAQAAGYTKRTQFRTIKDQALDVVFKDVVIEPRVMLFFDLQRLRGTPLNRLESIMNLTIINSDDTRTNVNNTCEIKRWAIFATVNCPWSGSDEVSVLGGGFDVLITIDFSKLQDPNDASTTGPTPRASLLLGMMHEPLPVLQSADPITVYPGLHLTGTPTYRLQERISNYGAAAFGLPQYDRSLAANIRALAPDLTPAAPSGNQTATLRLFMPTIWEITVEQQWIEHSVLSGFSLLGGAWTSINGVFAAFFGSTLLVVLFGIKPLSVYGLVHALFGRKDSKLVGGDYKLPSEEQAHTVALLRDHLLDTGDDDDANPKNQATTPKSPNPDEENFTRDPADKSLSERLLQKQDRDKDE